MTLLYQLLLLIAQAIILLSIAGVFSIVSRNVFQRYLNPGCWFALFYTLWFLTPQLITLGYDNFVIGYPEATAQTVLRSQQYLAAFLVSVLAGVVLICTAFPLRMRNATFPARDLKVIDSQILWLYYLCGLAATLYLGRVLMTSEGFRSELVKTWPGIAATTVQYFGVFAMAVLAGHALVARRYLRTFLVIGVFGAAVFFTGARGRVLWPIALAIAFTWCRADRIRVTQIAGFLVAGSAILLVFDPLWKELRQGLRHFTLNAVLDRVEFADLFVSERNFDGFANFALISGRDLAAYSPKVIVTGGRSTFMGTYFPEVLESGVAFGTTLPGLLWLSGGLLGLLAGGAVYGLLLGLLWFIMLSINREPLVWSYLFAMTWIAAVGGDIPESLDKMLVMALPGVLWWLLAPRSEPAARNALARRLSDRRDRSPDALTASVAGAPSPDAAEGMK